MTDAPTLIAFDISKRCTGIADGRVGSTPTFLSLHGAGMSDVAATVQLGRWLIDRSKLGPIDSIYFEAPLNPGAFMGEYNPEKGKVEMTTSPETTICLAKLVGVVEFVADMLGVPAHPMHVQSIRKAFLGEGRPKSPKQRARGMCKLLGWEPHNLDEADAGAVWYVGATKLAPRLARIVTPIEQHRVSSAIEPAGGLDVPLTTPLRVDRNGQEHIDRFAARRIFSSGGRGQ